MIKRRGEAAGYLIMIGAFVILMVGSYLMAYVEPPAPDSNIKDANDAFWWAFVTITTVGYGDQFPVTDAGRIIGMVTMATGIAIFGLLTSFITRLFLSEPADKEEEAEMENALHSRDQRPSGGDRGAASRGVGIVRADLTDPRCIPIGCRALVGVGTLDDRGGVAQW